MIHFKKDIYFAGLKTKKDLTKLFYFEDCIMKFFVQLCLLTFSISLFSQVSLTGDTNFPRRSLYISGQAIEANFQVNGLKPEEQLELLVDIKDYRDQLLKSFRIPVKGDDKGRWKHVVSELPNREWGFYRVYAMLSNGVILPKRGTRPAGFLTYAVVPDPASRPVPEQDECVFGFHAHYYSPWLGARSVMKGLAATPELYQKSQESAVKHLRDVYENIDFVTYFHTAFVGSSDPFKQWTSEQLEKHSRVSNPKTGARMFIGEEGERLYKESVKKIVSSAVFQRGHNKYMSYQPMWEPNIGFTPSEILSTHKAAFEAIREADPSAKIMGLTYSNLSWDGAALEQKKLFERGLLDYMDVLSLHPYCPPPLSKETLIQRLRDLRRYIKQHAKERDIQIHATEFGISMENNLDGDLKQLNHMMQTCLILLGEHVSVIQPFYTYDFMSYDNRPEWTFGVCYNLDSKGKSHPWNVSPKPWFSAYSFLTFLLEGFHSNGMISVPGEESMLIYRYADKNDNCIVAAWDHEKNSVLRLPVGKNEIEIADVMGKRTLLQCPGMIAEVTLSPTPVYLIGVAPELYGSNVEKQIQPNSDTLSVGYGNPLCLTGKLFPPKGKGPLELRITFPEKSNISPLRRELDEDSLNKGRYVVEIPFSNDFRCGKYNVSLSLNSGNDVLALEWISIELLPPLQLENVSPNTVNGKPVFAFQLRNICDKTIRGEFHTKISRRNNETFKLNLEAGETKTYEIYPPEGMEKSFTFRFVILQLDFELDNNYRFSERLRVNYLSASYLPQVGLDNDFSGWSNPKYSPIPDVPVRSRQYYKGVKDLKACAALGWNEHFLLLNVIVEDDHFVQPFSGLKTWNGDSIQCGFAKNSNVPATPNEQEFLSMQAYSEINYALSAKGPEAYRTISFDRAILPEELISAHDAPFQITKEELPDGRVKIHYLAAIPWRFLNITSPYADMNVYWAMTVNDRDDADIKKQPDVSAIGAYSLKHQAPCFFGPVKLEK